MYNLRIKYNLDISSIYGCKGIYSQKLNAVIVDLHEDNLKVTNTIIIPENE